MSVCKSAVILAGGKSSRMKFDKQLLVIDEKRLIYDLANKLENHFNEIIIVTNKPEFYNDCSYKVVVDEIKECGPLSGIHIG
ncbi:NTP transferase domain-containing protein, partial [Paraclostridium benzoelyticum]|nr:NTP transferase domain-containing protein [Paraclostridium benzoelyticum]